MEHVLLPEKYDKGRSKGKFKKDKKGNYMYNDHYCDETVPNLNYLFENGIGFESHPADWFGLFFPKNRTKTTHPKAVTIDDLTSWTNTKAIILNAGEGGGRYKTFTSFTIDETMSHLALYTLHCISPSPQEEMKLKTQK